jgi:signal peptide peptidase SppA
MKLLDLVCSPWALVPAQLEELIGIYAAHLRGEKIDIKAVEARLGRPLANEPRGYEVIDGVAVLPIEGVMAPKANLFMQVSGGVSTQLVQRDLRAALDDPTVNAIVLQIDSPGGSVIGTPELAGAVFAARARKPVVAYSDGQLASAAYWVGSAADSVYISGPTALAGSIGVVVAHRDQSELNRAAGLRITEISAGKYKRIASGNEPLSAEGRATLQAQVDYLYSIFVDAVARNRGTSTDAVLERMADGRVFIGQQAIDAGLVDGVATLPELIAELAGGTRSLRRAAPVNSAGAALPVSTPTAQRSDMPTAEAPTRESLERDHAALYAQLRSEFLAEAAAAERARIVAVREQSLPGHEALIERLAFDGHTTGPEAAAAVLAAERASRTAAAAAHFADAPQPIPGAAAPSDAPRDKTAQVAAAKAYATEHGCDFVAAWKALGYAA